jgi:hypothetical protein
MGMPLKWHGGAGSPANNSISPFEGKSANLITVIRGSSNEPAAACDQEHAPLCNGAYRGNVYMEIKAMQPDDADPIPLRMSQHGIGTLVIRFIGLLFLSVTALALVWIR